MNLALKRFGSLLQLFLLVFGLTAHALALDPSDASPTGLVDRISNSSEAQPDGLSTRPEVVNPSDFTAEKPLLAEAGPFEKEEEEEVHTHGISFKDSPAPGSGSSAFFCALATAPPGLLTACLPADRRPLAGFTSTRKHILLQVFRI
jgi:hypothetical protein